MTDTDVMIDELPEDASFDDEGSEANRALAAHLEAQLWLRCALCAGSLDAITGHAIGVVLTCFALDQERPAVRRWLTFAARRRQRFTGVGP